MKKTLPFFSSGVLVKALRGCYQWRTAWSIAPTPTWLFCVLLIIVCLPQRATAQDEGQLRIDSLRRALQGSLHDTAVVNTLNVLASAYSELDADSTMAIATRARELAERIGFQPGLAEAWKTTGFAHMRKEELAMAATCFDRALGMWKALGNVEEQAHVHDLAGWAAQQMGDFPKALEHYLVRMRIVEKSGDQAAIADLTSTIANVYDLMGNATEAIRMQREALRLEELRGDSLRIARVCNNLGTVLDANGEHEEALELLERALRLARSAGNRMGEAMCTGSIANHYQRIGDMEQALRYNDDVIRLCQELGAQFNLAGAYINTGEILTVLGRYEEAKKRLDMGIELSRSIGAKQWLSNAHAAMYDLVNAQGNAAEALEHYKLHIAYRDSITNEANTRKAVEVQMQYDFDKKEAATRAEQEKKDERQRLVRNSIAGGFALSLLFLGVVWRQRNKINVARKRSDELLLNILPEEVADELKHKGHAEAKHFDTATILFTDFKGFTQLSEQVSPAELVAELNTCFKVFDGIMEKYRIEKIKTIGDAYMAAGGLPDPQHGSAADVVRAALEMQDFMRTHKAEREAQRKPYFEMRLGIHTGPVVAGIVGVKKFQYDIWGDTVNTASRMESSGEVGQVNISEATYALVKDAHEFNFTSRGHVQAKGKGEMAMFFVRRSLGVG